MRFLFDHGTPSGIAKALSGHQVTEAIEAGWDRTSNSELLKVAKAEGFDLLLTTAKRRAMKKLHVNSFSHIGNDESFAARGFDNIGAWNLARNMFSPVRETCPGES